MKEERELIEYIFLELLLKFISHCPLFKSWFTETDGRGGVDHELDLR